MHHMPALCRCLCPAGPPPPRRAVQIYAALLVARGITPGALLHAAQQGTRCACCEPLRFDAAGRPGTPTHREACGPGRGLDPQTEGT